MPKQSFALEAQGPKRLEIQWKGNWKNVTITLDGEVVGTIPDSKSMSFSSSACRLGSARSPP